jgi:hypothetical protein
MVRGVAHATWRTKLGSWCLRKGYGPAPLAKLPEDGKQRMKKSSFPWFKLLIATAAIAVLVGFAAKDLAPNVPVAWVLAYAFAGGVLFVIAILLVMWIKFLVNRFLLNAGATDTDWLWFKSDPRGIQSLRGRDVSDQSKDI